MAETELMLHENTYDNIVVSIVCYDGLMPILHDFPRRESHDRYRQTSRSHGGKEQRIAFKNLDFNCRNYHFAAATIDFAVTTVTLLQPITNSVPTEYDVSDSKTAKMTNKNFSSQ